MDRRYHARTAGCLHDSAAPDLGDMCLPTGRAIFPDPTYVVRKDAWSPRPVLWITDKAVEDVGRLWNRVAADFTIHGFWPLVLKSMEEDDRRPWHDGELDPTASTSPDACDAADVLATWWQKAIPPDEKALESLSPYGRTFAGPAPTTPATSREHERALVVARLVGRLGLVPTTRPADVVARIGWQGASNVHDDMGPVSAVLRSWEDRFGAYVVGMGFDTLTLAVQRPPATLDLATAVAAEHFAMCPDTISQTPRGLVEYARTLRGSSRWDFWWD